MKFLRTLLIAVVIAAPSIASAQWGLIGTHETDDSKCKGSSKKALKVLDKWKSELGGKNTRKAWKALVDVGGPGCDAILEHMNGGGQGFESEDWADIGGMFFASGVDPYMSAGRALLLRGDPKINHELLDSMEPKLIQLTADEAMSVSSVDDADARKDALGVLIGHHSEGQMTSTMGIPHWEETAWIGATTAPTSAQIEAVQQIIDAGDADTRKTAAEYIQRLFVEGNANQEAWAPVLVGFIEGTGDEQDAADYAARGLGAAAPEGMDGTVEAILAMGNKATIENLIDGLELRLGAGRGDKSDLARLQRIADEAEGANGKKAARLVKKFSKSIK